MDGNLYITVTVNKELLFSVKVGLLKLGRLNTIGERKVSKTQNNKKNRKQKSKKEL